MMAASRALCSWCAEETADQDAHSNPLQAAGLSANLPISKPEGAAARPLC